MSGRYANVMIDDLPEDRTSLQALEAVLKNYLAGPWRKLRFSAGTEATFNRVSVSSRTTRFLRAGWIGLVVFDVVGMLTHPPGSADWHLDWLLRLAWCTPLAVLGLTWLARSKDEATREWLASSLPLLAAASVTAGRVLAPGGALYGLFWLLAITLFGNLVMRPRFHRACVFSAGIVVCEAIYLLLARGRPLDLGTGDECLILGFVVGLSLATKHRMEKDNRVGFAYRLLHAIRVKMLEEVNDQLRALAQVDVLTGLYNRLPFSETFPRLLRSAARNARPIALLFMDVDEFKALNDSLGHARGDAALAWLGQLLRQKAQRPLDLVARYGGEEFVIVLPDTGREAALAIAERIRREVEAGTVPNPGGSRGCMTVSIGVTAGVPDERVRVEDIVQWADEALYAAKRSGRNAVRWRAFGEAQTGA